MDNRTTAIILVLIAVLLLIFPGFAAICFGLAALVDSIFGFNVLASTRSGYLGSIFGGVCGGIFLLLLAVLVIVIAIRRGRMPPGTPIVPREPPPAEPITPHEAFRPGEAIPEEEMRPPITPQESVPPEPTQEPVPPEGPTGPEEPTPPDEKIPPPI